MFLSLFPNCLDPRNWSSLLVDDAGPEADAAESGAVMLLSDEQISLSTLERTGFGAPYKSQRDSLSMRLTDYVRESESRYAPVGVEDVQLFLDWSRRQTAADGYSNDNPENSAEADSVEYLTLKHRLAATRFAERRRFASEVSAATTLPSTVTLNPDHVWSRVQLEERSCSADQVSAAVFLFAVDSEVRAVQLTADVATLLRRLEQPGPHRMRCLVNMLPGWTRQEVWQLLRDLQQLGIIAIS